MYCYRVTKYNPLFRNENGAYQKDEWTSYSDIGKVFDGQVLTPTNYLQVEDSYIKAIGLFMEFLTADSLTVVGLEKNSAPEKKDALFSVEMLNIYYAIGENEVISQKTILTIARLCLRSNIWCRLESDKMFVHFGYDYYMYVGSKNKTNKILVEKIEKLGLFIEQL